MKVEALHETGASVMKERLLVGEKIAAAIEGAVM